MRGARYAVLNLSIRGVVIFLFFIIPPPGTYSQQ